MTLFPRRSAALALALSAAAPTPAQEAPAAQDTFELGSLPLVEVHGQAQKRWTTPYGATVNAEDLRAFERNELSTALALLPGVTVQNSGGRSEKLVYVRGFNSRQVPLFVDGIPVYVPYDGNFDLSRLLTFDVAEVQVSKGFSSVLYGANALGGSINVVSRRPREPFRAQIRSGIGLDADGDDLSRQHYVNLEGDRGLWYWQANLAYAEQDAFRLPDDFRPSAAENGGLRENSTFEDAKLSLKLGYTPNDSDEYALSYQRQEGEKNTPPYAGSAAVSARFWRWPEYDKESLYFLSRTALGEQESLRVRVYYDTFQNTLRSFDDASHTTQSRPFAFNSLYDDYAWGMSAELATARWTDHDLKAALQYKRDVHREHDLGAPEERMEDAVLSLGLEDSWSLNDRLSWVNGLGWDRQEGRRADDLQGDTIVPFATATATGWNAQSGLRYALSDTWTLHASIARRTRFPTIKDRYSYRMGTALPNPGLEPESAVNLETGLSGSWALTGDSRLEFSGALFQSRIDDSIESVTLASSLCSSPPCSQLQNIGRQENSGLELALTAFIGDGLEAHANYSYLDRDNLSSPTVLPLDTPSHKVFAYLRLSPLPSLDLLLSSQYESERYSATNGTRRTDSFSSSDAKAVWRFRDGMQAELGVRNLSDELVAYEEGYPEPGRHWFMNLQLDF